MEHEFIYINLDLKKLIEMYNAGLLDAATGAKGDFINIKLRLIPMFKENEIRTTNGYVIHQTHMVRAVGSEGHNDNYGYAIDEDGKGLYFGIASAKRNNRTHEPVQAKKDTGNKLPF